MRCFRDRPDLIAGIRLALIPGRIRRAPGSGVSSAAGVPTGWAITLDLVRKLAHLEGGVGAEPEVWYRERFGSAAGYSDLLNRLGATQSERQAIIRGYIEPSDEERAQGPKVPTDAHQALARLTASGHVRVIITTNFDRLIEQAPD